MEGGAEDRAWTSYGRMVLTVIVGAAASSAALVLVTLMGLSSGPFSLVFLTMPSFYFGIGLYWLVSFAVAILVTATLGTVSHTIFWNIGWRRLWQYMAGAIVFSLLGGILLGSLKSPVFYLITSGIVGASGGASFHWMAYRSRTI